MANNGPKQYHWTTHKFYCTDCEAPRFASKEAIGDAVREYPDFEENNADEIIAQPIEQWDEYLGEGQVDGIVSCFSFCLACAYGPEEWAKECSNPEGEWGDYKTLPERIRQTADLESERRRTQEGA